MGDLSSIPGLGRSPGEGNSYPLQYSSLENSMNYSPWDPKELDMTEQLSLSHSLETPTNNKFSKSVPWTLKSEGKY